MDTVRTLNFRIVSPFPTVRQRPYRVSRYAWISATLISLDVCVSLHILDHEDAGMMAKIQVLPAN